MKKLLTVFLVLVLLAAGAFLYKGGHHAVAIAQILEESLDTDNAVQSVTVQVQIPGARVDPETGQFKPHIAQYQLTCDTFVTEYADRPLLGLVTDGASAYTDGKILCMDTGKAYSLPELSNVRKYARKIVLGLLLKSRITKHGDTYEITMKYGELEMNAALTADNTLRSAAATVVLPNDTAVIVSAVPAPPAAHPIPQPVLDAMVLASMEPPMPLTEPLEFLLPALEGLLPVEGNLTLGVECGILNLSETAVLRMDTEKAELERNGTVVALSLPGGLSRADPAALALLLLRSGSFTLDGSSAQIGLDLTPETTGGLCAALVPQLEDLGIEFGESRVSLTIRDNALTAVSMTAQGEVPFLITTIPVSFTAELHIPE